MPRNSFETVTIPLRPAWKSSFNEVRWYIRLSLNPVSNIIIRPHTWVATLLSGVVVLALTGNALAAVFCPHMSGRQCCVKAVTAQPDQSANREHNHIHHADMDMSDEAMDMSDAPAETNASRTEA